MAKKVLIIDDDEVVGAMLTTALGDAGYQSVLAQDALEGLAAAMSPDTGLILLDMQMPGGGINTFIKLGRDPATAKIPVFFTTALPASEVMPLLPPNLQCEGYFQKPFDVAALVARVKQVLG